MISVGKLLENKGCEIWSVSPDDSVFDAVRMMDQKGIGALSVVNKGAMVGIISERDCAREVILKQRDAQQTRVSDIMTRQVFYTHPEQDVEACLSVMTKHHIRHLPVMQDEKLVGMISLGDVVKDMLEEQQDKIDHLEHYLQWDESY